MKALSLNGTWRMTGGGYDVCGTVPGSMYSFLLNAGLMEDPYYRDNEFSALALSHNDYTFERTFTFEKGAHRYLLRFEGLDTLCDVSLNGTHVAHTDNMHVTYEFDVTDKLTDGENRLTVVCRNPDPLIKEKSKSFDPFFHNIQAIAGLAYIRKAHCMFGWDWGPFLPDMGIWRGVSLLTVDSARITDLHVLQKHADGHVYLTADVQTDKPAELRVTVTAPDGEVYAAKAGEAFDVPAPKLWWPRGLGEQPLYTVRAEIVDGDTVCDSTERRIGLRTMELVREKDRYGESFKHRVNGVEFFAMGADYIPEDNILSRCTAERSRVLLKRCADANFNALRVWGGGYYPDDYFFDICDELGLVVFFDLAFACMLYVPDDAMMASIQTEVRQNLTRLRHHPSIAVVCGNNELESCNQQLIGTPTGDWILPINIELFEGIIADIAKEVCPELPYIHTSPITIGRFCNPSDENFGDSHYWDVWHQGKPFTEYRNHYFRYLSEFGFQSFPCEKTVEAFTLPEDRNIFSRVMEMHQRNAGANAKIVSYLSQTFLYPTELGTLLYASQLLQAEAMKYGVEHMRRNRGRCMGTLYWQLNDIWPVASWASIDYYGRLKALHYYAKRFYSPVLISCEEIGETTTRPFVIMEPGYYDYETKASLSVTNDTLESFVGTARGYLRDASGRILKEYEWPVTVAPMSVTKLPQIDFEKTDVLNTYYSYELIGENGERLGDGCVLFTAPKHFHFVDPHLSARIEGDEIVVTADAFAKSVEIDSPSCDFVLSDNYFDMHAGERRVKILEGKPENLRLRSVFDIR